MSGAVFDACASRLEIRTDAHFSAICFLWKFFLERRIPFAISGAREDTLHLIEMMRVPFLVADSLAEASGICHAIGPSIRTIDEESFQRIWGEHRAVFYGRNGRTTPQREIPSAKVAELYLRSREGEGGSP